MPCLLHSLGTHTFEDVGEKVLPLSHKILLGLQSTHWLNLDGQISVLCIQ